MSFRAILCARLTHFSSPPQSLPANDAPPPSPSSPSIATSPRLPAPRGFRSCPESRISAALHSVPQHLRRMFDKFKEECGVFGVLNHRDAANIVYLGLYALQHRGQESAGIASVSLNPVHSEANIGESIGSSGAGEQIIAPGTPQIHVEKEMGHVADRFGPERVPPLARRGPPR